MNLEREELARISSAPWFDDMQKVELSIIGLGGIGSYVSFAVSRLGVKSLNIFDGDVIEKVNMTGQLFSIKDIGTTKSETMGKFISNYSNMAVNQYDMFLFDEYPMSNIVICGVDSMDVRKKAFNQWFKENIDNSGQLNPGCLFIDGRLAAESLQVFTIQNKEDAETYKNMHLFDDSEADEVICSYKQTTYSAMMIGSIITNILVNFIFNTSKGKKFRSLPFLTTYECSIMKFETFA